MEGLQKEARAREVMLFVQGVRACYTGAVMWLALLCWFFIVALLLAGFAGSFLPLLPGTPLILAGAFFYNFSVQRLLMQPEHALGAGTLWGLAGLMVLAHLVDFGFSLVGANQFGASRRGVWGGVLGLVVCFFFGLPGMLLGPVVGVVAGEVFGGRDFAAALRAAWGTAVGTAAGTLARVSIAFLMLLWFGLAVWFSHAAQMKS